MSAPARANSFPQETSHEHPPPSPHLNRRELLAGAAATMCAAGLPAWAYPSKPLRWIVAETPASAGVSSGVRQAMGNAMGQRVMIDNRPGAGGTVGTAALATSPADGYTLCTADNESHFRCCYSKLKNLANFLVLFYLFQSLQD